MFCWHCMLRPWSSQGFLHHTMWFKPAGCWGSSFIEENDRSISSSSSLTHFLFLNFYTDEFFAIIRRLHTILTTQTMMHTQCMCGDLRFGCYCRKWSSNQSIFLFCVHFLHLDFCVDFIAIIGRSHSCFITQIMFNTRYNRAAQTVPQSRKYVFSFYKYDFWLSQSWPLPCKVPPSICEIFETVLAFERGYGDRRSLPSRSCVVLRVGHSVSYFYGATSCSLRLQLCKPALGLFLGCLIAVLCSDPYFLLYHSALSFDTCCTPLCAFISIASCLATKILVRSGHVCAWLLDERRKWGSDFLGLPHYLGYEQLTLVVRLSSRWVLARLGRILPYLPGSLGLSVGKTDSLPARGRFPQGLGLSPVGWYRHVSILSGA